MEELNLRIKHKLVGSFQRGQIVPVSAIRGGWPAADKLVATGAAEWVGDAMTIVVPASGTAVEEMTDDQLKVENEQLRRMLQAVQLERDEATANVTTLEAAIREFQSHDIRKVLEERDAAASRAEHLVAENEKLREYITGLTLQRDELVKRVEELESAVTEPAKSTRKK